MPLLGCATSVIIMIGLLGFIRMESNSNFIKFYCVNAYFKYGNEYSFNCKIFTIKKRISSTDKEMKLY